jgi:hypothetical protein
MRSTTPPPGSRGVNGWSAHRLAPFASPASMLSAAVDLTAGSSIKAGLAVNRGTHTACLVDTSRQGRAPMLPYKAKLAARGIGNVTLAASQRSTTPVRTPTAVNGYIIRATSPVSADVEMATLALLPTAAAEHFSPRRVESRLNAVMEAESIVRESIEEHEAEARVVVTRDAKAEAHQRAEWRRLVDAGIRSRRDQLTAAEAEGRKRLRRIEATSVATILTRLSEQRIETQARAWLAEARTLASSLLEQTKQYVADVRASMPTVVLPTPAVRDELPVLDEQASPPRPSESKEPATVTSSSPLSAAATTSMQPAHAATAASAEVSATQQQQRGNDLPLVKEVNALMARNGCAARRLRAQGPCIRQQLLDAVFAAVVADHIAVLVGRPAEDAESPSH